MLEQRQAVVDPYAVLTVQRDAPYELIAESYWLLTRLARETLPLATVEARVRQLTQAYERLSSPERRRAHDDMMAEAATPGSTVKSVSRSVALRPAPADAPDYYALLHVDRDARPELIALAHGIVSGTGGAARQAVLLAEARKTLLDPGLREQYDATLRMARRLGDELEVRDPSHVRIVETPRLAPRGAPRSRSDEAIRRRRDRRGELESRARTTPWLSDEYSARRVMTAPQKASGIVAIALIAAGLLLFTTATIIALVALTAVVYVTSIAYKAYLGVVALNQPGETAIGVEQPGALVDDVLPVYTLILPLYRETEVLDGLIASISALDYPANKLDVKLLLEEDDVAMQRAVAALDLPAQFETLVVQGAGPQGKPRACNYGLVRARGTYLALYDAEDRPEPDQLKKALVAFTVGGPQVACVQAKLNFYNPDQNLLTKWFTIEYSTWFDLYLPALNRMAAPIPLGGTSNHFRVDQLRALGAWDAYNVTEDADLGLRLARYHLRTSVIDSVTYEEANSRLGNWLRQRSRWVKGYMQTWLVHMRHPLKLFEDLGPAGFLAFQVMVLGTFFTYLINPIFWVMVIAWYTTHAAGIQTIYPGPVLYISALAFFAGNFLFIFTAVAGALQRGYDHGVKYALANHLYWALMSIAAWKAVWQLVRKPHYWEKTQHGLDTVPAGAGLPGSR